MTNCPTAASRRTLTSVLVCLVASILNGQWTQVNTGITDLSQGAQVLGASMTHIFAKAGSTLYRSSDNGDSWSVASDPVPLNPTECGFLVNGRYIAGLNASTACIHYTDDNGDTWTAAAGAPTATVVRGFFAYGGGVFAFTSNAGIYGSLDGGGTWQPYNDGLSNLNVIAMAAYGPNLLACTIGGGVFLSPNGGNNWSGSNVGIGTGDLNGEQLWSMGGTLYYTAQGGARYSSSDLGASWSTWTAPAQFGLGLLEVKRFGSRIYIETRHFAGGGLRDSIFISNDEGAGWTNITANLNASDLNGSGLFENNGRSYIAYNLASPGQGIYRYSVSAVVDERSAGEEGFTVFPNPTTGLVTVVVPEEWRGRNYALYSAAGVNIRNGRLPTGVGQLDITTLDPGCYFLRWDDPASPPVRLLKR